MNVFLLVFIILAFNVLISNGLSKNQKKIVYILSCTYVLLIVILRSPYDGSWSDTLTYLNAFSYMEQQDSFFTAVRKLGWEPGILIVAKLIGFVSKEQQAYIIGLGLLTMIPQFWVMYRYSSSPVMALFVYYAMGSFFGVSVYRAALAMSFTFIAFRYAHDRKLFRFLLWMAIAIFFHTSAAIFLAAYLVYYLKPTPRLIAFSVALSLVLAFFSGNIIQVINLFIKNTYGVVSRGGYVLMAILLVTLITGYYYCRDRFKELDFRYEYMLVLVAAVIHPMTFSVHIFSRFIRFYMFYIYMLIPRILDSFETKTRTNKRFAVLIEIGFMGFMLIYFWTDGSIRSYLPFWEQPVIS